MKTLLTCLVSTLLITVITGCDQPDATSAPQQQQRKTETDKSSENKPVTAKPEEKTPAADGASKDATPPAADNAAAAPKAPPDAAPAKKPAPPKSNQVQKISFDNLNCGMQADIVFRPWMLTEQVKELDGQRVRISGYMNPDVKQHGITEFILLRNTECKFGPTGQADHLIRVTLAKGVTASFSSKPVQVVGKLIVNPFMGPDGKTWCIFDMDGESVGAPTR